MASGPEWRRGSPRRPLATLTGRDIDLARVIEAQGEWNEHTGKSLAALVECLRTLRDDWTEAQARLRQEMSQLSAIVEEMRTTTEAAAARASGRLPNRNAVELRARPGAAPGRVSRSTEGDGGDEDCRRHRGDELRRTGRRGGLLRRTARRAAVDGRRRASSRRAHRRVDLRRGARLVQAMLRPRSSTVRPGDLDEGAHLLRPSSPSHLVSRSHASRLLRQVRQRIRRRQ